MQEYILGMTSLLFSTEADMKREVERKELEKKKSGKVDFITGGVQAPISAAIPKIAGIVHTNEIMIPICQFCILDVSVLIASFTAAVSAAAAAGAPLVSISGEGVQKEARPNKKSKWDKVFKPEPIYLHTAVYIRTDCCFSVIYY